MSTMPTTPLGQRIAAQRLANGLTQAELARRVGIRRPTLNRIERGHQQAYFDTVCRIARELGVTLDVFAQEPRRKD